MLKKNQIFVIVRIALALALMAGAFVVIPVTAASVAFGWAQSLKDFPAGVFGFDVYVDETGNVYTTGSDGGSPFISKMDNYGNITWYKNITGMNNPSYGYSITVDHASNVIVTGPFNGTGDFDPGLGTHNLTSASTDIFILKLDKNADYLTE